MGKKKDGAKAAGVKLPKRVGGVKVPKEWRRGGEALIAQAQSPAGQAAIAQGVSMVAALAASAAKAAAARSATPPKAAVSEPAASPAAAPASGPTQGDVFAKTVTAGVEAALGRLFAKR